MKTVLVLSLVFLLTSCASIVSKSSYPVSISSQPSGAGILITNKAGKNVFSGQTPATVNLKAGAGYFKGQTYTVSFSMKGYDAHTAQIERGTDGWYLGGNLIFGGLIGWLIVDPATGAMWTLKDLHVELNSSQASSLENGLRFVSVDDVPADLRSKLVRIN